VLQNFFFFFVPGAPPQGFIYGECKFRADRETRELLEKEMEVVFQLLSLFRGEDVKKKSKSNGKKVGPKKKKETGNGGKEISRQKRKRSGGGERRA